MGELPFAQIGLAFGRSEGWARVVCYRAKQRLREQLEENPAEPKYVRTKWGVGYYYRK